jgi:UDP:flavonoid glycosyltransferase YjiC (YdhE family)
MARVLLMPGGAGAVLAHAGACAAVAHELAARGHEPILAYTGRHAKLIGAGLRVVDVEEIDAGRLDPTSLAGLFRDADELVARIEADAALLRRLEPDVVVVDLRLSAPPACELVGVPHVAVMQFTGSRPWRAPEPWWSWLRRRDRLRRAALKARARLSRDPLGFATLVRIVSEARLKLGLDPTIPIAEGDFVACASTPLLSPMVPRPSHWRYVGPILWSAPSDESPPRSDRPVVHVTQGSTGSGALLRRIVQELRDEPVDVLVSTADLCEPAGLEALAPNVIARRLVSTRDHMVAADVAVVHGGNLTTTEAHRAGTPVVVVPHGFDQHVWADRAERLGTGVAIRKPMTPGAIRRAVRRVLRRERYRRNARAIAEHLRRWNGPANVADLVEELASR